MWWFLIAAFFFCIAGLVVVPMTDPYYEGHGPLASMCCGILASVCLGVFMGSLIYG